MRAPPVTTLHFHTPPWKYPNLKLGRFSSFKIISPPEFSNVNNALFNGNLSFFLVFCNNNNNKKKIYILKKKTNNNNYNI